MMDRQRKQAPPHGHAGIPSRSVPFRSYRRFRSQTAQEWRKKMSLATGRGAWPLAVEGIPSQNAGGGVLGRGSVLRSCAFMCRDPRRCLRALQSHGQVCAGLARFLNPPKHPPPPSERSTPMSHPKASKSTSPLNAKPSQSQLCLSLLFLGRLCRRTRRSPRIASARCSEPQSPHSTS